MAYWAISTTAAARLFDAARSVSIEVWVLVITTLVLTAAALLYAIIFIAAPIPRASFPSEKTFVTVSADGAGGGSPRPLPCWQDAYLVQKERLKTQKEKSPQIEPAEVFMTIVIPAYNEKYRLGAMLHEAICFLKEAYPDPTNKSAVANYGDATADNARQRKLGRTAMQLNGTLDLSAEAYTPSPQKGWEIILVSDGSTDSTVPLAIEMAQSSHTPELIRVVQLVSNRGKGGAVTHGMRHARGRFVAFADADGASKFADLAKLVAAAEAAKDASGRAVAVGSRAHLVGSEAVVRRSALRNFLMHSFHLLLRLLTPPATSRIRDTQCGFKLFTREALPDIVPHMHSEGWIFDVEMLMLAEMARVPMVEVPVGWKEVGGSKLNVLWDSLGMAWGLAILRAAWTVGVYRL